MIQNSVLALCLAVLSSGWAVAQSQENQAQRLATFFEGEVQRGTVVGAQVVLGASRSDARYAANFGTVAKGDPRPVVDGTLFCLASCSKPIASAVVFTLLDRRMLSLNTPAGDLIPAFRAPRTAGGKRTRSPTLRELLAHRGGVYSQMEKHTQAQNRAIRDFRLSMDESVALISEQPLSDRPGQRYSYSGAGYMLVGKMAENAGKASFEDLLQNNLCGPMGMESTTYFPERAGFDEIAVGGATAIRPPHLLGSAHQLPLIGGSLYSTASDIEKFVRQLAIDRGSGLADGANPGPVLSERAREVILSPAFATQAYGYGWRLIQRDAKVAQITHKGSLPPYQAYIWIDLQRRSYAIVFWTLGRPAEVTSTKRIVQVISSLFEGK